MKGSQQLVEGSMSDLRRRVESGEIAGVSIDTSYFRGSNWGFEHGVLKRLRQFSGATTNLILSDIVVGEVRKNLLDDATNSLAKLKRAMKELSNAWNVDRAAQDQSIEGLLKKQSPQEAVESRMALFLEVTEAVVVKSDGFCDVAEIISRYFSAHPPFGSSSDKKNEFPDAFALTSLEEWGRRCEKKIIVVSADGDWRAYCDRSKWLIRVDDLAQALSCFQVESDSYILNEKMQGKDFQGVLSLIQVELDKNASVVDFDIEADSQFHYDIDIDDVSLSLVEVRDFRGKKYFSVIDSSEREITAQLYLTVSADVEISASFEKWDGIDREYISMGGGQFKISEEIDVEAILVFDIDRSSGVAEVQSVELVPTTQCIRMGEIEPDWMSDGPEDEY
ncbi:PIN domain-containing protein [Lysobacter sp. 5GHs7-4]|uniref:PIN domain-containing protein n=1 Tax=Lysobacter sp. 5GHs7-4 TaxID=2904253 RepID=UPI001E4735F6|nr:PIN domain-containing protein [Lysobacter sp. 5GHs7-4]UHQ22869.1 PIN domain-containing protein [Lysobacter sp. 5GHs7-4]